MQEIREGKIGERKEKQMKLRTQSFTAQNEKEAVNTGEQARERVVAAPHMVGVGEEKWGDPWVLRKAQEDFGGDGQVIRE